MNKAPDKIYVSHLIYDTWQYTTPNPDDETEVEYIRKDALMEWAKERYTGLDITKRDMWDGGYNCAIKEIIGILNEM